MHLSVAAADRRANSSFSHKKPQRFFVISCIGYCSTSGDLGLLNIFHAVCESVWLCFRIKY